MTENQLQNLIYELQLMKQEIVDKLEEIRCGGIDIEAGLKEIKESMPIIYPRNSVG